MNGGLAKTTNITHAYKDPNLFGMSFKLFPCWSLSRFPLGISQVDSLDCILA